ncbi:MAG: beta-galactosidase [candidate division Zixibacteria bacterium]|nr:beta-galactosidase [candidate division Zixibacteria bacterium]
MLGVIGNQFSIGKETYPPFSAEFHYFRIEKKYWSICFERIKRAGFRIISTAVPWNVHQDESKHFDFAGLTDPKKDLIVFLELAREFGFKVILRPGPWVAGQVKNGGLPNFPFNDLKVFARNSSGQETQLKSDYSSETGYLPSYLHNNFQFHLRSFFKAFIEISKNYVHPRGPVFMVELDYETSFGRLLDPGSADYNPDVLAEYYVSFLEELYGDIKKLNSQYKEKNARFETVEPPRKFTDLELKRYPKVLDWFRFREYILRTYLKSLEDIFTSYTVEPLIFRSLYFRPGDLLPAFNLIPEEMSPFLSASTFPDGTYFDLAIKGRFLKAEYGFAFASSFPSGAVASNPESEGKIASIDNNSRRFYFAAAIASGFKGLNHYMFVDRDHWYGAPLHHDGTVSPGYNIAKQFNTIISNIGIEEMENEPEIAVVGNRLYSWLNLVDGKKTFAYVHRLLDESTTGFCRDLMRLKINFGVRENREWETIDKYKLLFIPSTEIMSKRDQEAIVELVKSGQSVILCGLVPKYDENFKDCRILANHFRIKTTIDCHIGSIEHKTGVFPTHIYGTIRSTDQTKTRKMVMSGTKTVGVCCSRFNGNLYFFSFDISSEGNHKKLAFIESILDTENLKPKLYCNDPSVDISFQMGKKKGLLSIVVPPPGELSDVFEAPKKEIIIQADLKALGINAPRIKLIDIFSDEEQPTIIRTTSKELANGLALNVQVPEGMIYLVQKY